MNENGGLKKELAWWDCSSIVLGIIIGTGIFSVFPQLIASHNISVTLILVAWASGGCVAWLGAMCYSELASVFPFAGGDYHYLRKIFQFKGKSLFSFLFAWAQVLVIRPGSIAALALIVGNETNKMFIRGASDLPGVTLFIALLSVALLTVTNSFDIKSGKRFQNIITVLKISSVIFIIVAGFVHSKPAMDVNFSPLVWEPGKGFWQGMVGFWSALVLTMWVYGGWNEAAYVAEDMKNPSKDVPKALFAGISVAVVVYVLMNLVYIRHLSPQGLAATSNPASDLMLLWFGTKGGVLMSSIIIISAMGAINGMIFTSGRMSYAISRDYSRLNKLAALHTELRTPRKALLANLAVTSLLIALSGGKTVFIENLMFYTSGVFWFFIGLVVVGLLLLRRRLAPEEIPFKVPLFPWFPLVFLAVIAGLIWGAAQFKPFETFTGMCVLALGIPLYYALNFWRKDEP